MGIYNSLSCNSITQEVKAMTEQHSNEAVLARIEQIAMHGEALTISLIEDDHGKGMNWQYVAAMLDDLKNKFTDIQRISQQ